VRATPAGRIGDDAAPGWISVADRLPVAENGTTVSVIVACKRARDGQTYVFAAEYANEFELGPGHDEDTRLVTDWFESGVDTWGEFDNAYQRVCGDGDEITHWMPLPAAPASSAMDMR
jgi:hypothetical protein